MAAMISERMQSKLRNDFDAISYDLDKLNAGKWKDKEYLSIVGALRYSIERIVKQVESSKGKEASELFDKSADSLKEIFKFYDQHPDPNFEITDMQVISAEEAKAELKRRRN